MIRISFTGSRKGMTSLQKKTFVKIISTLPDFSFLHGDCIGADSDAHNLVLDQGMKNILIRPCYFNDQRAFSEGGTIIAKPGHPLARNKKIVDDGDQLIACPSGYAEERRSGTWATIRYARAKMPILIIWPNGKVTIEQENKKFIADITN